MTNTFLSSRGIELILRPVSQFKIDSLNSARAIPISPKYDKETITGEKQTFEMDEKSAESLGRVEELNKYKADVAEESREFAKRFMWLIFYDGIDVDVPDADSEWEQIQNEIGMTVPSSPVARKIYYITSELIATELDAGDLTATILGLSGASREAVDRIKASFRAGIQRTEDSGLPAESITVEDPQQDV